MWRACRNNVTGSTRSGGSGWNGPTTRRTGPGASTSWPSRKTGWSYASWRPTGKPRWPNGHGSVKEIDDLLNDVRNSDGVDLPASARPLAHTRGGGPHRRMLIAAASGLAHERSDNRTNPSLLALAMVLPSGANATDITAPVWPVRILRGTGCGRRYDGGACAAPSGRVLNASRLATQRRTGPGDARLLRRPHLPTHRRPRHLPHGVVRWAPRDPDELVRSASFSLPPPANINMA